MKSQNKLPIDQFKFLIQKSILIAVDLILKTEKGEILVGLRKNEPARNTWFVPGGRLFKNESLDQGVLRIAMDEVGFSLKVEDIQWRGVSDHIYSENTFEEPEYGTHYVVLLVEIGVSERDLRTQMDQKFAQHSEWRLLSEEQLLIDPLVHPLTKRYFDSRIPGFFGFQPSRS